MPNIKSFFWLLIRKESAPHRVDWASLFVLVLYVLLVVVLVFGFLATALSWG